MPKNSFCFRKVENNLAFSSLSETNEVGLKIF